jgi:hypothetical protein
MPTFQDPKVTAATCRLKGAQTRLTRLRTRHLEGDFVSKEVFESFVLALANDFRRELLSLPGLIRSGVDLARITSPWELEDACEAVVDKWMLDFSQRPLPLFPVPVRSKGAYCMKPGPKPKQKKINGIG